MLNKITALLHTAEQMVLDDPSIEIVVGTTLFKKKPTTSKYSVKKYKCTSCGHESMQGTNHYGEIYPRCKNCGWKHHMEMGQVHVCLETLSEGMGVPTPWKTVTFGEICTIS